MHGKPLTTAYISRDDPRTLTERAPVLQHFRHLGPDIIRFDLAAQGLQVLNDLDVGWVVLDRYKMPGGDERSYTEAAAAEIFGDRPALFEDERITAYEVPATDSPAPYLILGEGWGPLDDDAAQRAPSQIRPRSSSVRPAQPRPPARLIGRSQRPLEPTVPPTWPAHMSSRWSCKPATISSRSGQAARTRRSS